MQVQKADVAWLAGIMDGEGNFHLGRHRHHENGCLYLDVKVRISSTDMRMIKHISEIYKASNYVFHYAAVNWNRGNWKRAISINIGSHGSCLKVLKLVQPYLINKRKLADIIIEIVDYVINFPRGGNTTRRDYFETDKMEEMWNRYEIEKAWYFDPSTTTRKANTVFVFDDMV